MIDPDDNRLATTKTFGATQTINNSQKNTIERVKELTGGIGVDTAEAVGIPAIFELCQSLEVLAANNVEVMIANGDEYTPAPVISYAILKYNKGRKTGMADGIVITPSHNPPDDGGFKYNPPNGGPAGNEVVNRIEKKANELL